MKLLRLLSCAAGFVKLCALMTVIASRKVQRKLASLTNVVDATRYLASKFDHMHSRSTRMRKSKPTTKSLGTSTSTSSVASSIGSSQFPRARFEATGVFTGHAHRPLYVLALRMLRAGLGVLC